MSDCCNSRETASGKAGCDGVASAARSGSRADASAGSIEALSHFGRMIPNCLEFATQASRDGRPIVGILCEFTPRELILAAGGVPVCLCGGSSKTITDAEARLPANLCPLIKSTYGYHLTRKNPLLEMCNLVVAETTCDGKKKMYELMGQSRQMYVLELPQKSDDADAAEHWYREILKFKDELERRFHKKITEQAIRQAIEVMNRERRLRRALAETMRSAGPALTGRQLLELKSSISAIPADLEQYERALVQLSGAPAARLPGSFVRVLMTGVPLVHGAERVIDIIESAGGLVVCMENCTGIKPILEDIDEEAADPIRAIAEKYFHLPCSVMTPNNRRQDVLRRLAAEYRPDCVIELIWQACITYDVESFRTRRLVEQELGLPYLRIETDYSPSDSARIAVRVEALYETVRGRMDKIATR